MREDIVLGEIQRLVSATLRVDRHVSASDELIKDLDLDSADLISLAIAIERHFDISLPEDEIHSIVTVGDLCHAVTRVARDGC
jgi:acyl carrier protein